MAYPASARPLPVTALADRLHQLLIINKPDQRRSDPEFRKDRQSDLVSVPKIIIVLLSFIWNGKPKKFGISSSKTNCLTFQPHNWSRIQILWSSSTADSSQHPPSSSVCRRIHTTPNSAYYVSVQLPSAHLRILIYTISAKKKNAQQPWPRAPPSLLLSSSQMVLLFVYSFSTNTRALLPSCPTTYTLKPPSNHLVL